MSYYNKNIHTVNKAKGTVHDNKTFFYTGLQTYVSSAKLDMLTWESVAIDSLVETASSGR